MILTYQLTNNTGLVCFDWEDKSKPKQFIGKNKNRENFPRFVAAKVQQHIADTILQYLYVRQCSYKYSGYMTDRHIVTIERCKSIIEKYRIRKSEEFFLAIAKISDDLFSLRPKSKNIWTKKIYTIINFNNKFYEHYREGKIFN